MGSAVKIRRYLEVEVEDFGKRLKEARLKDGRSVQLLATLSNISLGYWYQLEKEERKWISEDVLRSIEETLGMDFQVSFDDVEPKTDAGIGIGQKMIGMKESKRKG